MFTKEFINNMNYKARLILKLESAKVHNPGKYFSLAREHNINPQKFHALPAQELREIVGVLEGEDG